MELYDLSLDVDRISDGVWVSNVKDGGDAEFLVLGYSSKKIRALAIELEASRPDKYETDAKVRSDRLTYEAREKIKAALLGFRKMTIKGKPWDFDPADVAAKLDDPRFERFQLVVSNAMNKADETRLEWEAEAEKNSSDGSGTSSETA